MISYLDAGTGSMLVSILGGGLAGIGVFWKMIRAKITDPWKEVSWEEAISYAASEFKRIQAKYGKESVGGITSSRCTNEETYLVQKLVRAAFGTGHHHRGLRPLLLAARPGVRRRARACASAASSRKARSSAAKARRSPSSSPTRRRSSTHLTRCASKWTTVTNS